MTPIPAPDPMPRRGSQTAASVLGGVGVLATLFGGWALRPVQFNVVSYAAEVTAPPDYPWASAFAVLLLLCLLMGAVVAGSTHFLSRRLVRCLPLLAPLALNVPLATYGLGHYALPFAISILWIASMGWTAWRIGRALPLSHKPATAGSWPIFLLLVLIVGATVVHTRLQTVLFEHFMLGHADIGHYLEELKNALAGRGLRSDSFPNTRLGWHFSPSLYAMAPLYSLWPSPTLLMVCSALFLHIGALPVYFLSRRLSGSSLAAFLFALAWLLHPSISRMVYSNTYGFQWTYTAIPLTLCVFGAIWTSRWSWFWILVVAILLVQETTAAAVFGIGIYLLVLPHRRREGLGVMILSVAFLAVCVTYLIPAFAASGRYERMDLFGRLGGSFSELVSAPWRMPGEFFDRLGRAEGFYLLAILLSTLAFLPFAEWRVALAAVPSLVLVFLLQNKDWLSIKFWHQAAALPILFCAAMKTLDRPRASQEFVPRTSGHPADRVKVSANLQRSVAVAAAVLFACAWGHYLYGFSPISKSFEVFAADPHMREADPRMEIVERLRREIPRERTVLATERLAAHFADYRRVYTGKRMRSADYVLIDRWDRWDQTGLPARADEFARSSDYRFYREAGPIIVFVRAEEASPVTPDD